MGVGEARIVPESSNFVCLHYFGLCFALRGPITTSAILRGSLLTFDTKPKEKNMNAPNVSRQRWEILFDHNLGPKNQKLALKGYYAS